MFWIKVDPSFDRVRETPQFKELIKKMNLNYFTCSTLKAGVGLNSQLKVQVSDTTDGEQNYRCRLPNKNHSKKSAFPIFATCLPADRRN